ncbi:mycothiol synthase [Kribbella sandramycini]|uniref:Mycothiol acetyltransferase n=1 Tax=Kribbella sandramycini TaxID=60450 RepID=A0A7Y4L230_9ACTN|nr:mycothiol synthase [Kribbella sandramycini]NOL42915.1 mycothiol synthase [Kribbella sandramycini]
MTLEAVPSPLPTATAAAVTEIARLAAQSDGVNPLDERTLLHLDGEHPGDLHVLAYDGEPGTIEPSGLQSARNLIGYGALSPDGSAELVVTPSARRQGTGTAVLRTLLDHAGPRLAVWAHGRLPGADELAARLDLHISRELLFLRRPAAPLPTPTWPDGIAVRTFVPGQDDAAWLELNRQAFATHPEQGAWTQSDLTDRLNQPWFDPEGFFLATTPTGALAGFHWTKLENNEAEVYVVGVSPTHQGTGLGKALTLQGLNHLQTTKSQPQITLYVDGTNTPARRLYTSLGFTTAAQHVQYTPQSPNSAS